MSAYCSSHLIYISIFINIFVGELPWWHLILVPMGYLDVFLMLVLKQTSEYPISLFIFFEITRKYMCLNPLYIAKEADQIWFRTRGILHMKIRSWGRHKSDTAIVRGKEWCVHSCLICHPGSLVTSLAVSVFYINSLSHLYSPNLHLGSFFFYFDRVSARYFIAVTLLFTRAALIVWQLFTVGTIREQGKVFASFILESRSSGICLQRYTFVLCFIRQDIWTSSSFLGFAKMHVIFCSKCHI